MRQSRSDCSGQKIENGHIARLVFKHLVQNFRTDKIQVTKILNLNFERCSILIRQDLQGMMEIAEFSRQFKSYITSVPIDQITFRVQKYVDFKRVKDEFNTDYSNRAKKVSQLYLTWWQNGEIPTTKDSWKIPAADVQKIKPITFGSDSSPSDYLNTEIVNLPLKTAKTLTPISELISNRTSEVIVDRNNEHFSLLLEALDRLDGSSPKMQNWKYSFRMDKPFRTSYSNSGQLVVPPGSSVLLLQEGVQKFGLDGLSIEDAYCPTLVQSARYAGLLVARFKNNHPFCEKNCAGILASGTYHPNAENKAGTAIVYNPSNTEIRVNSPNFESNTDFAFAPVYWGMPTSNFGCGEDVSIIKL